MPKPRIYFFSEKISFVLPKKNLIKKWLIEAAATEGYVINNLNYIFCSDDYLLAANKKFLNHNTYTDIITFQYDEDGGHVSGDVFISIDRVELNAQKFSTNFPDELNRVMIHGLLHLCGYKDKAVSQKNKMRKAEDRYLKKLSALVI